MSVDSNYNSSLAGRWIDNVKDFEYENCTEETVKLISNIFSIWDRSSLCDFLLILIISLWKKPDDILEGINKLDHLLVVSIFQKYKNKEKERRKQSCLMSLLSSSNNSVFS